MGSKLANTISRINRAGGVTDEQRNSTWGDPWSGESDCPYETKYDRSRIRTPNRNPSNSSFDLTSE